MPDNELPLPARFEDHRRAIARLLGCQCAPKLLSSIFIIGDNSAALARRQANEFFAINERMAGETPKRRLHTQLLFEIVRPNHLPIFCIETKKVPFCSE